jgi:hypothetical protein
VSAQPRSEAQRAHAAERKRASRARHRVEPPPRSCLFCGVLIPPSAPSKRGKRPLFCSAAHGVLFHRRTARVRRLASSLESSRRHLAEIDAQAIAMLSASATDQAVSAAAAELAIRSLNIASGRAQMYAGLMAWLNPAATRYDRGGRPRKGKGP